MPPNCSSVLFIKRLTGEDIDVNFPQQIQRVDGNIRSQDELDSGCPFGARIGLFFFLRGKDIIPEVKGTTLHLNDATEADEIIGDMLPCEKANIAPFQVNYDFSPIPHSPGPPPAVISFL